MQPIRAPRAEGKYNGESTSSTCRVFFAENPPRQAISEEREQCRRLVRRRLPRVLRGESTTSATTVRLAAAHRWRGGSAARVGESIRAIFPLLRPAEQRSRAPPLAPPLFFPPAPDRAAAAGGGAGGGWQQASPATVFRIRLKQSPASLRHKMRVPELCRNFRCRQLSFPSAKAGFFTLLVVLLLMTSEDFNVSCSYMLD